MTKRCSAKKYGDKIILGVAPITLTPESPPEEVLETFKDYRIYNGPVMGVANSRKILYELSHIAFCREA